MTVFYIISYVKGRWGTSVFGSGAKKQICSSVRSMYPCIMTFLTNHAGNSSTLTQTSWDVIRTSDYLLRRR